MAVVFSSDDETEDQDQGVEIQDFLNNNHQDIV